MRGETIRAGAKALEIFVKAALTDDIKSAFPGKEGAAIRRRMVREARERVSFDVILGSYARLLIQAMEQIRPKKPFGPRGTLARLQLQSFLPTSAKLRKNQVFRQTTKRASKPAERERKRKYV